MESRIVASLPMSIWSNGATLSTFQSIRRLIEEAKSSLLLVTYALTEASKPLVQASAEKLLAGVKVTYCLSESTGGTEYLREIWPPSVPLPRILVPNRTRWVEGNMHAKFVISDERRALVTSANLTGWATDQNFEVGVEMEGTVAHELHELVMLMLRSGLLVDIR